MYNAQTRWIALLVILGSIILAAIFSIVVPKVYYGVNPNPDIVWQPPNIGTLSGTSTPSPTNPPAQSDSFVATSTLSPNCTRTAIYWVYRLEDWPQEIFLGNFYYGKNEAINLIQSPSVNVSNVLFIQFIAAYLNLVYGSDPSAIGDVMNDASEWLYDHPVGGALLEPDAQKAALLAKSLEDYNTGGVGPGRCPDDPSAYEGQTARIPVPVLSITPSNVLADILATNQVTPTLLGTATASPTITSTRPIFFLPTATRTDRPSRNLNPTRPPATQQPPTREPPPTEPPPPTREPPPTEPPP
jgi:hypothetical protein